MELINGAELQNIQDITDIEYKNLFADLLIYVKTSVNYNIIHGDLSPFNILIGRKNGIIKPTIIDWPQFIELSHPNALDILINDFDNIYTFFNKKTIIESLDIENFAIKLLQEGKKNLHIRD